MLPESYLGLNPELSIGIAQVLRQAMKVLILDTYATYLSRRLPDAQVILPSEDECLRQLMEYSESSEFRQMLVEHVRDSDVIVLGNNEGTGLLYIGDIPEEKRQHVLVVWNNYTPGNDLPYRRCGIVHFCSRRDAANVVKQIVP